MDTQQNEMQNLKPMNIDELIQLWPQFKAKPENQNGIFVLSSRETGGVIGFPDSLVAMRVLFGKGPMDDGGVAVIDNCEIRWVTAKNSPNTRFIILKGVEANDRAIMKLMMKYAVCNFEVFHGEDTTND